MTRVITGMAKGRNLKVPKTGTRPITDEAKSAVFSMLFDFVKDAKILDLYAGSGSFGIEALSRGAKSAIFVDNNPEATECIKDNLKACVLENLAKVLTLKSEKLIAVLSDEKFNIVFADPPFHTGILEDDIDYWGTFLKDTGVLVIKHPAKQELPQETKNNRAVEVRRYGESGITYYVKKKK